MIGGKQVVLDTWTPKQAASLSLFHEWEIIHEMKADGQEIARGPKGYLTLRDEVRRALKPSSSSSSSSEEEEEVEEMQEGKEEKTKSITIAPPRRDHTLHPPRRRRHGQKNSHAPKKLSSHLRKGVDLDCSGSTTGSQRTGDTDSGLDLWADSPCSECGEPCLGARERQRYHSSLSSTQDYSSDMEWDGRSEVDSSCPSPTLSAAESEPQAKPPDDSPYLDTERRRKIAPGWPHDVPALEPITLSIEDELLEQQACDIECTELRKVLMIGDSGVGKSSFVRRFVARNYSGQFQPTVGVDFALKVLQWSDNLKVKLQLWDIAGQERFTSMTRVYYKDAHACIIMFDLTQKQSFQNAARWKQDLDSKCTLTDGSPIPCMLLANKCDLGQQREVDQESIEAFIKEHNFVGWTETSVKTGSMVDESMKFLVDELMARHHQLPMPEQSNIMLRPDDDSEKPATNKCSC